MSARAKTDIIYGQIREGHPAAKVGDNAFALLPTGDGGRYIGKTWGLTLPMINWTVADFPRLPADVADGATFQRRVEDVADHQRQLVELGRHSIAARQSTPWGLSHLAVRYGEGVTFHITASHGGFHLTAERNKEVLVLLRSPDGFYEEDCAWVAVAQAYPHLFTDQEKREAEETLRHQYPYVWEAIHGRALVEGESRMKDRRTFDVLNADRWVVISAVLSRHRPGFVECIATLGGKRGRGDERRFLVPEDEYDVGVFGFVIDEVRHEAYDGASDFIGWSRPASP